MSCRGAVKPGCLLCSRKLPRHPLTCVSAKGQNRTHAARRSLFDHLVGSSEQVRWDGEAECLGSFEINDELKLRRLLHRQVAGMLTFEDAIDVLGRRPKQFRKINSIGYEPAGDGKSSERIDRG